MSPACVGPGAGLAGRPRRGFLRGNVPVYAPEFEGGGELVRQRTSPGARTQVVPGPCLGERSGLFFGGSSCHARRGQLCHLCLCRCRERFPGVSCFGALARPLRGAGKLLPRSRPRRSSPRVPWGPGSPGSRPRFAPPPRSWASWPTSLSRLLVLQLRLPRAEGCGEAMRCSTWTSGR